MLLEHVGETVAARTLMAAIERAAADPALTRRTWEAALPRATSPMQSLALSAGRLPDACAFRRKVGRVARRPCGATSTRCLSGRMARDAIK
jgi:hypothetical protein